MPETHAPFMIYAEMTPNPATMKFVANQLLVPNGKVYSFSAEAEATVSPLAQRLFSFPFVTSVFITQNFVTITKVNDIEWSDVTMEIREYLSNYLNAGYEVFSGDQRAPDGETSSELTNMGQSDHIAPETPAEQRIVEILDEYVRPAVEGDGGAIHFKSFSNGKLSVVLKGACNGCPSSTVTLKAGIQSLFERMMPEVEEVIAVEEA